MRDKVLVIVGPTASGKTDFAINCAKKFNGEIISCDSMQIYSGMDIGTAKATEEEKQGITHYNIDIVSPFSQYSAFDFVRDTKKAIREILAKNKLPILVGGTGLFIQGLIRNYDYGNSPKNAGIREHYENLADTYSNDYIYSILVSINPERAKDIKVGDRKRIIRALELSHSQENTIHEDKIECDYYVYALNVEREALYNRINMRVDKMLENGLVEEVQRLFDKGLDESFTSMKGIGYKELFPYFKNESSLEDCVKLIKQHTRNYAKRQFTWFKHMAEVKWIEATDYDTIVNDLKG